MAIINVNARQTVRIFSETGKVPTIPTAVNHEDPAWLDTDIYDGEICMNKADNKLFIRANSEIITLVSSKEIAIPVISHVTPEIVDFGAIEDFEIYGENFTEDMIVSVIIDGYMVMLDYDFYDNTNIHVRVDTSVVNSGTITFKIITAFASSNKVIVNDIIPLPPPPL